MKEGINSLWKNEDYWAIWFAAAIVAGALLEWLPKIPKVGKWSSDPLAAFMVIKDGEAVGTTLLPLLGLLLGMAVLTAIGVAVMRAEKLSHYLPGFVVVFGLACVAYWIANQTNVKYWGLSYAMWALLVATDARSSHPTPNP